MESGDARAMAARVDRWALRAPASLACCSLSAASEAGGSEGQLVALLERTHGVHIDARLRTLVYAADRRLTDRVRTARVPLVILGPQRNRAVRLAASVIRFVRLVHSTRPDLVYPWLEQSALLAAPLARLVGIPVLVARAGTSQAHTSNGRDQSSRRFTLPSGSPSSPLRTPARSLSRQCAAASRREECR